VKKSEIVSALARGHGYDSSQDEQIHTGALCGEELVDAEIDRLLAYVGTHTQDLENSRDVLVDQDQEEILARYLYDKQQQLRDSIEKRNQIMRDLHDMHMHSASPSHKHAQSAQNPGYLHAFKSGIMSFGGRFSRGFTGQTDNVRTTGSARYNRNKNAPETHRKTLPVPVPQSTRVTPHTIPFGHVAGKSSAKKSDDDCVLGFSVEEGEGGAFLRVTRVFAGTVSAVSRMIAVGDLIVAAQDVLIEVFVCVCVCVRVCVCVCVCVYCMYIWFIG
jgi:hypothetical protein